MSALSFPFEYNDIITHNNFYLYINGHRYDIISYARKDGYSIIRTPFKFVIYN